MSSLSPLPDERDLDVDLDVNGWTVATVAPACANTSAVYLTLHSASAASVRQLLLNEDARRLAALLTEVADASEARALTGA